MRLRWCALALVLAACHEPPVGPIPPLTTATALAPLASETAPAVAAVAGEISAPAGSTAKGRLVLGWRTADEEREVAAGRFSLSILRQMMDRMSPGDEVDFARTPRVHYRLDGAPRDATPLVFLDVGHTFWATLLGGGQGLVGKGPPGGGLVKLAPNPPHESKGEACEGPRYKLVVVDDAALGKRRFCAFLPESWAKDAKRRYPIILLLPGIMSNEMSYLAGGRHAGVRLDAISKEMSREAVLVGVDTSVPTGSTYLEDSPVTGPWDTFLSKRALPVLERELHIIPQRTARGLLGQSTGGYSSLSYGMRHSELFSAIGASSPDAPDVEQWLLEPGTRHAREWVRKWARLDLAVGGPGQITSWAADWSPDASAPRGFRYPFDVETGTVDEPVLARWVAKTPHGLVRDPAFVRRVKKDLSGRIMIIVGRKDDFELFTPAESFAKELESLGVTTRFIATNHGHSDHLERFEPALHFLLERLDPAR